MNLFVLKENKILMSLRSSIYFLLLFFGNIEGIIWTKTPGITTNTLIKTGMSGIICWCIKHQRNCAIMGSKSMNIEKYVVQNTVSLIIFQ